jgi:hypothetical protein
MKLDTEQSMFEQERQRMRQCRDEFAQQEQRYRDAIVDKEREAIALNATITTSTIVAVTPSPRRVRYTSDATVM